MQKILVSEISRLDIFLSKNLQQSRHQIATLIKNGGVKVNDHLELKPSFKLKINDEINVRRLETSPKQSKFDFDFDINVLYEDEDLLVLNKPPKLVVHAALSVKEATLVDYLLAKNYALSTLGGELRAGLVHRLDKDTSGAILIAKNNATHKALSEQLLDKSMGRLYLALSDLPLKENYILVEKALARNPHNRLKKIALDPQKANLNGAKSAKSAFINLLIKEDKTSPALIAAKLFSGRTHQIRAHLESLNRHILGDELYGFKGVKYERVMLHAYFLYFMHPKSQKKLCIKAPIYDDFYTILQTYFTQGELDEKTSFESIHSAFNACI
ncbi:RluA family pseudouridine synthase [Campylobacter sp. MIT 97-5078]|uniref:RluA family pseudouridine synthase n=1 Tax=Campylobacter sp. MIT 97-5078 TaxID=1548153 RepID=UPI000513ECCB|nr:RluA family pseudouridine synthase [Campylobacter sp. MIT 97-5078]KGI56374.1 pseudouridine synthase [Campylobacter sp. MIT 97-5078]KGI56878.1 pseudouridine synthase [Campylobacter sp. MIT 97-5078]KGI56911.1 pseudouridine synthase [Campylobacter sp. MIT 97-5078]TQR26709.1 RluA family pseudouridine synthase [Campylobacter sp. MIT 97-5078]